VRETEQKKEELVSIRNTKHIVFFSRPPSVRTRNESETEIVHSHML